MLVTHSRRQFLSMFSLASAASFVRVAAPLAGEPLETTIVRLAYDGTICSPLLVAEELLATEGFAEVRFVNMADVRFVNTIGAPRALANAGLDFKLIAPWDLATLVDGGEPLTALGGIHIGCFELFAKEGIRSIADLKGKSVGRKAAFPSLLYLMAAHVGLDPKQDVHWVVDPVQKPMELFAEGKIDAFLGFPPEPQELRARDVGHVILNTVMDPPW